MVLSYASGNVIANSLTKQVLLVVEIITLTVEGSEKSLGAGAVALQGWWESMVVDLKIAYHNGSRRRSS